MLQRIPFWGWLLIILAVLYLVYNPLGFSVWHMWTTDALSNLLPLKVLITLLIVTVMGLVIHATVTSMSLMGFGVLVALIAAALWSMHALVSFSVLSLGFWAWAAQPLLALILTIGWQWPKIWRRTTGAVSVNDPDTSI